MMNSIDSQNTTAERRATLRGREGLRFANVKGMVSERENEVLTQIPSVLVKTATPSNCFGPERSSGLTSYLLTGDRPQFVFIH